MKYICKKELYLPTYDDNGFIMENEQGTVPIGSVWYPSDEYMIGGEVHLECESGCDDFGWIEITRDDLANNFEEMKGGAV